MSLQYPEPPTNSTQAHVLLKTVAQSQTTNDHHLQFLADPRCRGPKYYQSHTNHTANYNTQQAPTNFLDIYKPDGENAKSADTRAHKRTTSLQKY